MQWGAAPSETAYGDRLQKARESEAAGQWDQALWCYQEMEALKPGDKTATDGRQRALLQFNLQRAGAYYKDGLAAEQKNSLLEARDDLEMASRLDPGNRNYSKALDRVTSKSQQPITVASSPSGKTAQLLTTESDLYLSKGRPDLAKKKLKEALKEQPQNPEIKEKLSRLEAPSTVIAPDMVDLANRLYEQGLQKYLGGDLDGAIRAWEDTLKADPSQTRAQNNLIHAKLEKEAEKP
jgi:tetratricopeptide (TPR) repeat protein